MKTNLFKIFVVFLLTLSIWGCKYDFVVPEPEPVPDPVVEVSAYALPESISYAGTTTIYWNSKNVTSVTLNDSTISTSGSKTLTSLLKDTSLILKFKGYNGQVITKSVQIAVAEPPVIIAPTMYDTISSLYWVFQVSKGLVNGEWLSAYFDEDMRTRKWSYYKNQNYEILNKNGVRVGNGTYKIKQNILELDNDNCYKFKISLIDSTMLIYNMDSTTVTFYKGY